VFAVIGITFTGVLVGMQFGIFNVRGSSIERNLSIGTVLGAHTTACDVTPCEWQHTPEWTTVREGLTKDALVIQRVSQETGVPARLIAAVVVPEQLRFFTSERETYKQIFEPLKILGSLSQFSLGVAGIKQETARDIESRLPKELGSLITYPAGAEHDQLLYERLTDPHDHYWSYLYAALFIQEMLTEWSSAGYPIDTKPGVVVTLFNIGFQNSHPNATPQIGGASIDIGGATYLFGELGDSFFNSAELRDVFVAY
jgi:hypothetical protein